MTAEHTREGTEDLIRRWRECIDRRLDELLPAAAEPPGTLHRAMRHTVLGGGKRIRGVLCIAAHRLSGDPFPEAALDAACAIECLHAYTLIHDDLPALDDDSVRRGRPACHVAFGEAAAILAGDALQSLAFEILSGCGGPCERVQRAVRILGRASGSRYLVGGQVADLEAEGADPDEETVLFIHLRKTAALIAASLAIGGALAGAGERVIESLQSIGRDAGLAFQITDDLLDVEGKEDIVGKGLRKDIKKGKMTYPACCGVDRSRERARELIDGALAGIRTLGDRGPLQHIFRLILDRVS